MKTFFSALVIVIYLSISAFPQPQDSIFVIISGDTVHIWNTGAYENCASLFRMDVSISNDTVYVTEVDTTEDYVYCLCYFDMCASITGLPPGSYEVLVFREFPLLYPDTSFYIGSTSFVFGGSSLTYLLKTYQSDCYNVTKEDEYSILPIVCILYDNYPNPFNPVTTFKYGIPERTLVELRIYDILGREVELLVNEEQDSGYYEINFNANNLSGGIYLYQLKAGNFIKTKKMILLK